MNKLLLLFVFPLIMNAQAPYKKIRVLFIGNSYTYVNNLPLLVYNIALSKGDTLIYDSYAPGGYTFSNHFNDANSFSKITQGNWDYVVLQAQSQEPSFPPAQVNTQTFPYATRLDSLVKKYHPCANTVFYETWGRKNGDAQNCQFYPPLCTYVGMQNRLRDSYLMFANATHALMAPAGETWRAVISASPAIELYQPDQSHPSLEGSYLTAAVFYETLFQKTVQTATYNPGIGTTTLSFFNQSAHQIVTDSAQTWNISKYIPKANFTHTSTAPDTYAFQAAAPNFSYKWYFGDGGTSTTPNPSHTYLNSGTYTVSLVAYNAPNCKKDSVSKVLTALVTNTVTTGLIKEYNHQVALYPNPCSSYLEIKADPIFENNSSFIEIRNTLGQLLSHSVYTSKINTSELKNGLYYLKICNSKGESNSCFIKNE